LSIAPQGLFSFAQKKTDKKKAPKGETTIVSPFGIPHTGVNRLRLEACVFTADALYHYIPAMFLPSLSAKTLPGF